MDPFSIYVGTVGLADAAFRVIKYLKWIRYGVDELANEVEALANVNELVEDLPFLRRDWEALSPPADDGPVVEVQNCLASVLQHSKSAMGELEALLTEVVGRKGTVVAGKIDCLKAMIKEEGRENDYMHYSIDSVSSVASLNSFNEHFDIDTAYPCPGNSRQDVPTPPFEWKIITTNFPHNSVARKSLPVRLENLLQSSDQTTLLGSVAVANLAFQKAVICRFTLDYWKTTSEVAADYSHEILPRETPLGHDRFTFSIKMADITNLEAKTLFLCVRYTVNGQEYWDTNNGSHFQVDFRKNYLQGTTSRPADVLPRSYRRNGNANLLVEDVAGDPADHLEMIAEGSDYSSEDPLTEPSSAPWSDEAATTEPSSLSYGNAMNKEYTSTADTQPLMNFYNYTTLEADKTLQEEDDVQSITSVTDDIGSLTESTSTMLGHREAATNYFVKKFTDDSELLALYQDAAERMDEARFVRNHRRLLKRYFLDLQSEGHTPSEKLAVRFLRLRSDRTRISSEICRMARSSDNAVREKVNVMLDQAKDKLFLLDRFLGQQDSTAGAERSIERRATRDEDVTSEASEDSDAGESETAVDGRLLKLDATAEFLTTGRPFSAYKQRLRGFLQLGAHGPEETLQLTMALTGPSEFVNLSRDVNKQELESVVQKSSNTDDGEPREQPLSSEKPQVGASAEVTQQTKFMPESTEAVVEDLDTDAACHRRVDSAERRALSPETETSSQRNLRKSITPSPRNGSRPTVVSIAVGALDAGMAKGYGKILTFMSKIGLREQDIAPGHQRVRWKNRRGKTLYDDYVEHEPGALHALQDYLNSSAYRSKSIPTSGQVHGSSMSPSSPSASSTNSMQASTSGCAVIADQARKTPLGNTRTSRFREDIEMGEVSTNTLHLLSCMERGRFGADLRSEVVTNIKDDGQLFHTLRKSYHGHRGRLRPYWSLRTVYSIHFMKVSEVVEAWGIYYQEDWDWAKIWWILGAGFFPPSLLFGILWGILKQDIQGAFGVASWWMAGATVVVGIAGTSIWTR
ncbi:hypothetical protein ACCO45_004502 [Purpureocillium lilacinum]|uniref:Uncharacterized protein n=1 Tax=Purpureocillium lilacinum TaxID=33203 RepID=A0ACC4E4B5_PURLI